MNENPLQCTNDDCKGTDFSHIGGSIWKCVYCGTIIQLNQKTVKKKIHPKKEVRSAKEYPPLSMMCEQCGTLIDTITHPRDEQRLNKKWSQHNCVDKTQSTIYS